MFRPDLQRLLKIYIYIFSTPPTYSTASYEIVIDSSSPTTKN